MVPGGRILRTPLLTYLRRSYHESAVPSLMISCTRVEIFLCCPCTAALEGRVVQQLSKLRPGCQENRSA